MTIECQSHRPSGRTASMVSELLINDRPSPMPAGARMSMSLEMPRSRRVSIYTVTKEELGLFRKAIPSMTRCLACLCLCFNLILPGMGTFISSFACLNGAKTNYKDETSKAFLINILAALLQLITVPIVIGFIWSILWGIHFIKQSKGK